MNDNSNNSGNRQIMISIVINIGHRIIANITPTRLSIPSPKRKILACARTSPRFNQKPPTDASTGSAANAFIAFIRHNLMKPSLAQAEGLEPSKKTQSQSLLALPIRSRPYNLSCTIAENTCTPSGIVMPKFIE